METPTSVAATMAELDVWWAVAGGWAIDLWLGEQTREHHDVEVVVRRRDQPLLHAALSGDRELFALDPPGSGWRPWNGVPMRAPAFQLQARSSTGSFDLFTEDVDDGRWSFRRDRRVSMETDDVVVTSASGLPIVRPEIQLLYMATSAEPKNAHDFQLAEPRLDPAASAWLANALRITLPDHPWRQRLDARAP
jgi:hypothetical protein